MPVSGLKKQLCFPVPYATSMWIAQYTAESESLLWLKSKCENEKVLNISSVDSSKGTIINLETKC